MAPSKATSMPARTPAKTPSSTKKMGGTASGGKQQSILGFFGRSASTPTAAKPAPSQPDSSPCLRETTKSNSLARPSRAHITPVPSSDAMEPPSSQENVVSTNAKVAASAPALPSPVTPAEFLVKQNSSALPLMSSSPIRKVYRPTVSPRSCFVYPYSGS